MFKKMFALASVTALTGLVATIAVAGCSSSDEVTPGPDDSGVVGDTHKPPVEAGDDEEPGDNSTCPTTATLDVSAAPFEPSLNLPGSCTNDQIHALKVLVDGNQSATDKDLQDAVPAGPCHDCLFAKDDGTHWAPFPTDDTGAITFFNSSSCIGIASDSADCDKAWTQFSECLDTACKDCPAGDQAGLQDCQSAAGQGACSGGIPAVQTACPDLDANGKVCDGLAETYQFEVSARAQCVGLAPIDGGADAGDGG